MRAVGTILTVVFALTGAAVIFIGSLALVVSMIRSSKPYVSPDPMGCCDCGIVCSLNMWHRCELCTALLKITDPRSPEVVDWVYQRGLRS